MAADAWKKYNSFPFRMEGKHIDFVNDTFKVALFTSASNANDPTKTTYGALTHELPTLDGYTAGGFTLTSVTLTETGATVNWTSDPAHWIAAGGALTFRFAAIYDSTTGDLVCWTLLDNAPADVSIPDGQTGTIRMDAAGIFDTTGM